MLCDDLEGWDGGWGREAQAERNICVHKTDSFCCTEQQKLCCTKFIYFVVQKKLAQCCLIEWLLNGY